MANLEVQVGANIKDFQSKIDKVEKDLKGAAKVSEMTGKKIASVGSHAAKGIGKMGKSTANATPALQEFSRVIQDAPFGIMGVGNNIQQLTANFGHLSKSAGGSKAALKAMIGALAGPGGVLLAVSAVTTILTSYGDEIADFIKNTGGAVNAQKELSQAFESDSYKAAIENVFKLNTTIEQAKKGIISKKEAVDEYNNTLGKSLGQVKTLEEAENSLNSKAEAYVKATLLKATANKVAEKAAEELADNYRVLQEKEEAYSKFQDKERTGRAKKAEKNTEERIRRNVDGVKKEGAELQKTYQNIYSKITADIEKLQKDFGFDLDGSVSGGEATSPKVSKKSTQDFSKKLAQIDSDIFKEELEGQFKDVDLSGVPISVTPEIDGFDGDYLKIQEGFDEITALENKLKNLQATSQVVGQGVGNAFSQMSSNLIGSLGLANSGFEGFIGGLSKTVTDLIAMMLAASISQSIAGATASGTATGPAAVFTTPAFIATAVGGILGAFAAIPKFATGTSSYSGDNNIARVNGNEMILQPNQSATLFNALKGGGASLKGGSDKTSGWNGEIKGNIVLRGENQKVQLTRADKKFKRFYG